MKFLKFLFGVVVVVALLAVIGKIFFFDLAKTNSYSMIPNLVAGDLFVVKTVGVMGLGDIAVCEDPDDPSSLVVLRIVGVPGMEISFWKNHLKIDGDVVQHAVVEPLIYVDNTSGEHMEYAVRIAEEYLGGVLYEVALMDRGQGKKARGVVVPKDHFFLVADNRNMGRDSRNFGFVPIEGCLGEAVFLLWPGEDSGDLVWTRRLLSWLH